MIEPGFIDVGNKTQVIVIDALGTMQKAVSLTIARRSLASGWQLIQSRADERRPPGMIRVNDKVQNQPYTDTNQQSPIG